MKRIYILISALFLSLGLSAQTVDDALRYSQINYNSTARSMAMGGAFGALGGDFVSASLNPAGLAVYRSSELSFSPTLSLYQSTSNGYNEKKFGASFGNMGYVGVVIPRLKREKGWQNFNFGVGYNRLNDFKGEAYTQLDKQENSMLDYYAGQANGNTTNNLNLFKEDLIWGTYLIDTEDGSDDQYIPVDTENSVRQSKLVNQKGYIDEFTFSFAANYSHKLYIGGTIGVQNISYSSESIYSEYIDGPFDTDLNGYSFTEKYSTSGIGINAKFGVIFRPISDLRLAASVATPTLYYLDDRFVNTARSYFNSKDDDGYSNYRAQSPTAELEYKLQTPMRANFGAAYTIGKRAIISVGYELVDYSSAEYFGSNGDYNYKNENNEISTLLASSNNIRAGAEYRLTPFISLRGGYSYFGETLKDGNLNSNNSYQTYSGGLGFKSNNFTLDLAYLYADKGDEYMYINETSSQLLCMNNKNQVLKATLKFRF